MSGADTSGAGKVSLPSVNRRLVLSKRPVAMVDAETVRVEEVPVEPLRQGEELVEVQWLSIDPTIRTWMDDVAGYLPPIAIGEVIRSGGIGQVIASNGGPHEVGSLVFGMTGWQEYVTVGTDGATQNGPMQQLPPEIDAKTALNVFGVTGMTAYFGLLEVGGITEGDTVVVSGAAGATGSTVGQIARIRGAGKVIGIAGGPQKCEWITSGLGFDAAIDYRNEDVAKRLRAECPDGIDLYWDNVGGTILDTCLAQLAMRGRVVLCGAISAYNDRAGAPGLHNVTNMITRRGRMEGFIVLDYVSRFPEAQLQMAQWLTSGELKHEEHVVEGLDKAPEALNLLFTGANRGKVLVHVRGMGA